MPSEEEIRTSISNLTTAVNAAFLLCGAFNVFFMQAGFTVLEAGVSRLQNLRSIILQNLAETCITALTWYLIGYSLAFGEHSIGGYVAYGKNTFALGDPDKFVFFMFMLVFAMATITIPSGALAERVRLSGYCLWVLFNAAIVVPPVFHEIWDAKGFFRKLGCLDFAGGIPVHTLGGTSATIGTFIIGPRIGRYSVDGVPHPIDGHSIADASVGCLMLWFGWFAFNPCSALVIVGLAQPVGFVAMNTLVCSSAATMFSLFYARQFFGSFDIEFTLNSALSALVAITPCCAFVDPWAAVVIGVISVLVYRVADVAVRSLMIDDPVGATQVHFANGIVGTLLNGIFAKPELIRKFLGPSDPAVGGFLYTGSLQQLGVQALAVMGCTAWTAMCTVVVIGSLHYYGFLRLNDRDEIAGLDNAEQGGVQEHGELDSLDQNALDDLDNESSNSSQNLDNFDELDDVECGDLDSRNGSSVSRATRKTARSTHRNRKAHRDDASQLSMASPRSRVSRASTKKTSNSRLSSVKRERRRRRRNESSDNDDD
eukprot:ANDGO_01475.mRNA.1 Ammonium transporter 2